VGNNSPKYIFNPIKYNRNNVMLRKIKQKNIY